MLVRFAVSALLLLHGLIHTMGFLKAWNLAAVPQLSGRTVVPLSPAAVRVTGALWAVTALALTVAALLRALDRDAWWTVAAPALVLSQLLIVLQWHDAWAGTVANVVLALVVAVSAGISRFHAGNTDHVRALLARVPAVDAPVLEAGEVAALPAPVRRWLLASGAVGRPRARTVRLVQRGGMRTSPDQAYMPVHARQHFTVDEPGFVWTVDVTMMRVVPVVGRDSFVAGHGRMLIKAAGLVTVADGTGPTFDQGTALRFLGEIVWFPSAAVSPSITWTPVDDRHAQGTIAAGGVTASAIFEFDERDRVVRLTADRYYGGQTLERWTIPMTEWRVVRGVEIPVRGGAVWKLAAGDFDYFQWEIVDVEVNPPPA